LVKTENFEKVPISSQADLRTWLEKHHSQKDSVWLVTYKKHIRYKYVSREEVLDELIAFGWIDGIRRKLNDDQTMQLISPRKAQHWAQTYKDRAERLIKERRMTSAGEDAIERSKKLGLWNFMDDVDALIKPQDLIEALEKYPEALTNFNSFGKASQRFVLRWIKLAKTKKTRQKRIDQTASLAAIGEKIPGS
jgi:uncharacterized protein YdeI (YjbR/CyaY-like superfamily)